MKVSNRLRFSRSRSLTAAGILLASIAGIACGELTGPVSPSTPVDVRATLVSPTSATVTWTPSPQSDGVISYNVFRNGVRVGESKTTSYTDTGLAPQQTYMYTVSANCTAGVLSGLSLETPAAAVTTVDVTPPRVTAMQPPANATGVSPAATVTATFSEPIDPTTLNATTFNLKVTATGAVIPGTVTYNAATRTAEFKPTSGLPNPVNFTATVTTGVKDISGNRLAADVSWTFTTRDATGPTVTSITPANGAVGVSTSTTINVTFSEAIDPATINATNFTVRTSSGAAVPGTVTYNAATRVATFTPSAPLASNTAYTVTIVGTVRDVAGNEMGANFVSSFTTGDNVAATVVSTTPADLATNVPTNVVLSATFSEAMDPATINATTFLLRSTLSGGAVPGTVAYNPATFTATFTPSSPLVAATTYTATITIGARDVAGNPLAASRSWTFITADNTGPTVLTVSPPDNASGVAITSAVTVTFSEPMNASTINTTTFNLRNTGTGALVAGTVTYNAGANSATFTPSAPLANGTHYTVTVTTGVMDIGGNPLATQFTSTFSTAQPADVTRPTVVATTPPNGATGVARNTVVTATFSEPIDPTSINSSTVFLTPQGGGAPVAGTVSYNAGTNTATFTPSSPLANFTTYTLTVTTGVKDVAGNTLATNFTSSFTTALDTIAPTVIATSPASNSTNVSRSVAVTVTFSENMDPATINGTTFTLRTTVGGVAVTGTVSYNVSTRVATFTLPSGVLLAPSTSYTATVTTDARDTAGNRLAGTFAFSFTTAP
ncbi:MAG: Ig-like domain-containing protein [Gemmatimonadaceae bacterium]